MSDPFYGFRPEVGIHVLKDKWGQKSHFGQQSQCLSENLLAAIDATKKGSPKRSTRRQSDENVYQLNRGVSVRIDPTERERLWERAAFIRWSSKDVSPVESCWSQLVAFQVPLFAAASKGSWGYVDLLGILADGTVSIIELKKEPRTIENGITDSSESPLRMILEALAYAIAIREDWTVFRTELVSRLQSLDAPSKMIAKVPTELSNKCIRLVGVAPAAYWMDWLPVTGKGMSVKKDSWPSFNNLLLELEKEKYLTSFLSLSGEPDHPESLAAQPLKLFPLLA